VKGASSWLESDREVKAVFGDRRWVFPREDCKLLPVPNTTAEAIARWIVTQLLEKMTAPTGNALDWLQVEVEENFGQWAICRIPVS
jgi:6-pyruvoyltetrahydropterin/6-carboxytetrahydropterin synthase